MQFCEEDHLAIDRSDTESVRADTRAALGYLFFSIFLYSCILNAKAFIPLS